MKVKIKSFKGDLPSFLTLGKLYNVEEMLDTHLLSIYDDNGDNMIIYTEDCGYLNGGLWDIVDECIN